MRRSAREQAVIQRRLKEYRQLNRYSLRFTQTQGTAVEDPTTFANKFRKRAPGDCGRARCGCCHSEKLYGKPTLKEKSACEAAAQQLSDRHADLD